MVSMLRIFFEAQHSNRWTWSRKFSKSCFLNLILISILERPLFFDNWKPFNGASLNHTLFRSQHLWKPGTSRVASMVLLAAATFPSRSLGLWSFVVTLTQETPDILPSPLSVIQFPGFWRAIPRLSCLDGPPEPRRRFFFSREMVSSFFEVDQFWGGQKKKGVQEKTVSFFFQNHDPLMRYLSTINWLVAFVLRHQGSACESRGQALNRWSRLWSNIRLEACYVPLHFSKSS